MNERWGQRAVGDFSLQPVSWALLEPGVRAEVTALGEVDLGAFRDPPDRLICGRTEGMESQ
jgi:hypothetical protein